MIEIFTNPIVIALSLLIGEFVLWAMALFLVTGIICLLLWAALALAGHLFCAVLSFVEYAGEFFHDLAEEKRNQRLKKGEENNDTPARS